MHVHAGTCVCTCQVHVWRSEGSYPRLVLTFHLVETGVSLLSMAAWWNLGLLACKLLVASLSTVSAFHLMAWSAGKTDVKGCFP